MNLKRYLLLLALQTIGVMIVLYLGLPFYRHLLHTPTDYPGSEVSTPLAAGAVGVMQVCYWLNRRDAAALRAKPVPLLRHLFQFSSRLNFGFVGSMFALVFYQRIHEVRFSPLGIMAFIFVLFSVYCYSAELDNLADAFKPAAPSIAQSAEPKRP